MRPRFQGQCNMSALVSVIMPAFNAEKFVTDSIESVLRQTYAYWELIVVDDGSTDQTARIVKTFAERDERIILIQQQNRKQAAARNVALRASKGEFIAFLDSDDIWLERKLETQIANKQYADVIFTGGFRRDGDKIDEYPAYTGFYSGSEMSNILFIKNPIPNLSVLVGRSWVEKIGMQVEAAELVGCEDWEYWLRLAKNGATFYGIDEKLFVYRVHSEGTSRNRIRMRTARFYAKLRNVGGTSESTVRALRWETTRLLTFLISTNSREIATNVINSCRQSGVGSFNIEYMSLEMSGIYSRKITIFLIKIRLIVLGWLRSRS